MNPRWLRILAVAALALLDAGCGIRGLRRELVEPRALLDVPHEQTTLKAHLRDGRMLVFTSWAMADGDRVVRGIGQLLDVNRAPQPGREQEVAVDSVALFESDALTIPVPVAALTVMTGVHVVLTAFCIAMPKACFGSCPTFYAWDGTRQTLVAEGFSASVAPALEATDLDALDRVRPRDGRLELTLINEALETHVVRHADLLVAPQPAGGRVLALGDGSLHAAADWRAPDAAVGPEGDCRTSLARRDGDERTSLADSTDLARRETIELTFDAPPAGPLGLVVTARQSLLSTYLFYQTLAWMGRSAGTWLASLGSADAATRARVGALGLALGGIEVQTERDGRWSSAGEFRETGPLAGDTRAVRLPAPPLGALHVRLQLARGMWRVDQAALVTLGDAVTPQRVPPARVLRRGHDDTDALARLTGAAHPLVTQPGDTLTLVYDLPGGAERTEIFLESRGYYLEWVRDAWIAEENPARLARMFLDPRNALREMAPEFKRAEPGIEAAFWGSRYAR